jgi:hypothetical protein
MGLIQNAAFDHVNLLWLFPIVEWGGSKNAGYSPWPKREESEDFLHVNI